MKLPGAAERALLVQLLLSPGRTIPATMLVDRLWSESTLPADPMNALQIRVSKLRRALNAIGVDDVVDPRGRRVPGERRSGAVDALDFADRIRAARTAAANAPTTAASTRPTSRPTTMPSRCGVETRSATSRPSGGPLPKPLVSTSCGWLR